MTPYVAELLGIGLIIFLFGLIIGMGAGLAMAEKPTRKLREEWHKTNENYRPRNPGRMP